MIKVYAINISPKVMEPIGEKLQEVGLNTRLQISKFRRHEDRVRKLYGELMIRKIIKEYLGVENFEIQLNRNKYGKPFLEDYSNFNYNISHSGDWVVCATSDKAIGIDVEQSTDINLEIVNRFFSKEEVQYLSSRDITQQKEEFFEFWTLKESYIKQIGMGFSINFKDFSIIKKRNEWRVMSKRYKENVFFKQYNLERGYKVAVCAEEDGFPEEITYFTNL